MAASTRSKSAKMALRGSEIANSGLTITPIAPIGGHTIGHRANSPPLQSTVDCEAAVEPAPRVASRVASVISRSSRAERDAARRRAEFEAAKRMAEIERDLVQKKLQMDLAEIEAVSEADAEEEKSRSQSNATQNSVEKVTGWLHRENDTHGSVATPAGTQRDQSVVFTNTRTPYEEIDNPHPDSRYEESERGDESVKGMADLAKAISRLARPRPVPRQAYELPIFNGNVAEWRLFKNSYDATTASYKYVAYENLARLRVALQGKARTSVSHLLAANSKPEDIMLALEKKFGRPEQIIEDALQQIKTTPRVTDTGREISDLAVTVRNCVAILEDLDTEGYIHNPALVKELLEKLTPLLRNKYAEHVVATRNGGQRKPNIMMLADFLEHEAELAAVYARFTATASTSAAPTRPAERVPRRREGAHQVHTQVEKAPPAPTTMVECASCHGAHKLATCDKFRAMDVSERWDLVKQNKICFKCIAKTHPRMYCRARGCAKCQRPHHTLLHSSAPPTGPPAQEAPQVDESSDVLCEKVTNIGCGNSKVLLKVVPVTVGYKDKVVKTYALLDDGASVTLLDGSVANEIDASGPRSVLRIVSARGLKVTDNESRTVRVIVRGPNKVGHELKCRTVTNLDLPPQSLPANEIASYRHLRECDIEELDNATPQLLIGQDYWELITSHDVRRGKSGEPVASLTDLGWVAHGRRGGSGAGATVSINCLTELHEQVKNYFELESLGIVPRDRPTAEVARATEILSRTSRQVEGAWETGLLWREDDPQFPDNYHGAKRRLINIEHKLDRDPEFANAYTAQIEKLIANKYAVKLDRGRKPTNCFYLPHFAVTNPNKPGKVRVVFDAAAKFAGKSLNDRLLTGPDLLNNLIGILYRFRIGKTAITGDIQDMFLRIKVIKEDQRAQLFLWRGADRDKEPDVYVMTSLLFGAASSPTTAIYILNENAQQYANEFPEAARVTRRNHYMDDLLYSGDNNAVVKQVVCDVTETHRRGGFVIRGWATNSPELRACLSNDVTAKPGTVALHKTQTERTLGLIWDPERDVLGFDLTFKKLPIGIMSGTSVPTKRQFLSVVMTLFDPLGLLCPVTVKAKIIMQRVWESRIAWDEKLRQREFQAWLAWLDEVKGLNQIVVPRWYALLSSKVQLHVFGDASESAYAAVVYWRAERPDGSVQVALVTGKARVAPTKVVSIPRLELQAALLATRLAGSVQSEHDGIEVERRVFWTDSKTVLKWIKQTNPRNYKPFVAHRLAEIEDRTSADEWRWVNSADNPADDASRDTTANLDRWLEGPAFLAQSEAAWPIDRDMIETKDDDTEIRNVHVLTQVGEVIEVTRFSSWNRLVRTFSHVLMFIQKARGRQHGGLTAHNIADAEQQLLRMSQQRTFRTEITALQKGESLPRSSRLRSVDPIIVDNVLRVGGRIRRTYQLSFEEKHPMILDGHDYVVQLLIAFYHRAAGHANRESVINLIREKYWIVRLRPTVKQVASQCRFCRVRQELPVTPKMADLPPARLAYKQKPFTHCGLDYFGPMEVTIGRRREKRWAALFTCLTTRAVHMEIAASLSADSAIMALRRMIARRGQPKIIYSDHGTNFVGAAAELAREDARLLEDEATTRGIEWRHTPPSAPHMGGAWERLVRAVKTALKSTLHARSPKEEVLHTLLLEAEFVVNSRPLTHVSVDPQDPIALTPNHFLLGSAAGRNLPGQFDAGDLCGRKQWKAAQALADMFWRRWLREYLPTLQQRSKWTQAVQPIKVDDHVIIADPALPRNTWPRGRVTKLYPGVDGQVRVVQVKTLTGTLRRPTSRLIVLSTESSCREAPTGGGMLPTAGTAPAGSV